jgi:hypothetical protein
MRITTCPVCPDEEDGMVVWKNPGRGELSGVHVVGLSPVEYPASSSSERK